MGIDELGFEGLREIGDGWMEKTRVGESWETLIIYIESLKTKFESHHYIHVIELIEIDTWSITSVTEIAETLELQSAWLDEQGDTKSSTLRRNYCHLNRRKRLPYNGEPIWWISRGAPTVDQVSTSKPVQNPNKESGATINVQYCTLLNFLSLLLIFRKNSDLGRMHTFKLFFFK